MRDGFIKVAAATPQIRVGDCAYNAEQASALVREAKQAGAVFVTFPELCLTGYTCGDLFFQNTLLDAAEEALFEVAQASEGILTVVGLPVRHGGKLYNCAAVCLDGRVLGVVPKTHLPTYGEFYERRQYAPAPQDISTVQLGDVQTRGAAPEGVEVPFGAKLLFCCEEMPEWVVGIEICEDLWSVCPPSVGLVQAGASVVANLSASNEVIGKESYRRDLVKGQSARLVCGYVYANAGEGESTTDMVFSGQNMIAENGLVLAESVRYTTGLAMSEFDLHRLVGERRRMSEFPAANPAGYQRIPFSIPLGETTLSRAISPTPFIPAAHEQRTKCCEDILAIQSHGLKKRLAHSQAKTAVVGISGGLDSALALLVTARAMDLLGRPRTDILAVTMPCFGTTGRTLRNAESLSNALGVTLRRVDITDSVRRHFADIGQDEDRCDVTYENAQARERTQVLMDIANQSGGLVVGTGDLSELALGWATYNGDHMSMYGVNASVPKTLVRYLVSHEAEQAGEEASRTDKTSNETSGEASGSCTDGVNAGQRDVSGAAALQAVLQDILDTPVSPELLPAADGEISQKTEDIVGPYELHDFFLYYGIRWAFPPRKVLRLAEYAFAGQYERNVILSWEKVFYRRFFAQQFKRSCLPDGPKIGSTALSPRGDWRMPSDATAAVWLRELDGIDSKHR